MATKFWNGGTAAWNIASNWGGSLPAPGDDVIIISGTANIGNNANGTISFVNSVSNLTITAIRDGAWFVGGLKVNGGNGTSTVTGTMTINAGNYIDTLVAGTQPMNVGSLVMINNYSTSGAPDDLFTQSVGTFNAGAVTVNNGTMTLSGGIFTDTGTFGIGYGTTTATVVASGSSLTAAGISISNNGVLTASAGNVIVNSGGVSVAGGVLNFSGGTFSINSGGLSVSSGKVTISSGNTLDASASAGTIDLTGGTITNTGTGSAGLGGNMAGTGGTIVAASGTLDILGVVSGSHSFTINSGATLDFENTVSTSAATVSFANTGGVLRLSHYTSGSLNFGGTIGGLIVNTGSNNNAANALDIFGTKITSAKLSGVNNATLILEDTTGTIASIALSGNYTGAYANWTTLGGSESAVFLSDTVCFAAGTRIRTDRGEVAVEALTPGDQVITQEGEALVAQPVKWIGTRKVDLKKHPRPASLAPVRIGRHAFADNLPSRDLVVSPPHALFIDGRLIPARLLVNGATIVQDRAIETITYYHVELDRHAILFAEGLPTESYLDTGNRGFFANSGGAVMLHPDLESGADGKIWDEHACAPLMVDPVLVRPIWDRLVRRAAALLHDAPELPRATDPDIHLLADGKIVPPNVRDRDRFVFVLPAGVRDLRLVSRASRPLDIDPSSVDYRALGVEVTEMQMRSRSNDWDVPLDHPALTFGWHEVERADGRLWRWTDGDAVMPVLGDGEACVVALRLRALTAYLPNGEGVVEKAA